MKERLTGAIILVALIVVLVPELLSGPIRSKAVAHGPGPSAEEPPLRSYTISLGDGPQGGSGSLQPQPANPPAPTAPAAEPSGAAPAALARPSAPPTESAGTPAPVRPTAPAAQATAASPAAAPPAVETSGGAYVVQLGSFASRANAARLAQQVRGLGYPVSVTRGSGGRHLYRVQAGPARDHASAEQMAAKLRAQGHGGTVVPK